MGNSPSVPAYLVDPPFERPSYSGPLAGKIPILSLRTNKADVVVGLSEGVGEAMDADPEKDGWRTSGRHVSPGSILFTEHNALTLDTIRYGLITYQPLAKE